MSSYSYIRYLYLRDNKNNPHSCVVVQLERESNVISYQTSTHSSKEGRYNDRGFVKAPFLKMKARYIACQRLAKRPILIRADLEKMSGHEITRLIMEDIVTNGITYEMHEPTSGYVHVEEIHLTPQRTRNAAKKWLKRHVEDRDTMPLMEVAIEVIYDSPEEIIDLLNKKSDTLPPSFSEDFAADEEWDSIPIPPVAVTVKIEHVTPGVQVVKIREELPSEPGPACAIG